MIIYHTAVRQQLYPLSIIRKWHFRIHHFAPEFKQTGFVACDVIDVEWVTYFVY